MIVCCEMLWVIFLTLSRLVQVLVYVFTAARYLKRCFRREEVFSLALKAGWSAHKGSKRHSSEIWLCDETMLCRRCLLRLDPEWSSKEGLSASMLQTFSGQGPCLSLLFLCCRFVEPEWLQTGSMRPYLCLLLAGPTSIYSSCTWGAWLHQRN